MQVETQVSLRLLPGRLAALFHAVLREKVRGARGGGGRYGHRLLAIRS